MNASTQSDLSQPNPFLRASDEIRACWDLGYHDGGLNVDTQAGEGALKAFATADHARTLREARDTLAQHQGEYKAIGLRKTQLDEEIQESARHVLFTFGNNTVGIPPWIVAGFYVVLAVLAVASELPLSGLTVGESLGSITAEQFELVNRYSTWALAAMLCLMGFSLKLCADVFDRGKGHRWWEMCLSLASLALCAMSIYGIAELREAIGAQQIAAQELARLRSASATPPGVIENALGKAMAAQIEMSKWTSYTFKWVTMALPCFAAVLVIVASHQVRTYRAHDRAVAARNAAKRELVSLAQEEVKLASAIEAEKERLEELRKGDPDSDEFLKRAQGAYGHGVATGTVMAKARVEGLDLYSRLMLGLRCEYKMRATA